MDFDKVSQMFKDILSINRTYCMLGPILGVIVVVDVSIGIRADDNRYRSFGPAFAFLLSYAARSFRSALALFIDYADSLSLVGLFAPSLMIAESFAVLPRFSALAPSFVRSLLASLVITLVVIFHNAA